MKKHADLFLTTVGSLFLLGPCFAESNATTPPKQGTKADNTAAVNESIDGLLAALKKSPGDVSLSKKLSRAYLERAKANSTNLNAALDDASLASFYDDSSHDASFVAANSIIRLRMNPDRFEHRKKLGDLAFEQGKNEIALVHYTRALSVKDDKETVAKRQNTLKLLHLSFWPPTMVREVDMNPYMMVAQRWMRSAWVPVSDVRTSRVRTHFNVGKDGTIFNTKVVQSSGDPLVDAAALDALKRASPFRPPPPASNPPLDVQFDFDYNFHMKPKDKVKHAQIAEGMALYESGKAKYLNHQYKEAIELLRKASRMASDRNNVLFKDRLADALLAEGDTLGDDAKRAIVLYQEAILLDPTYDTARQKWSKCAAQLGVDVSTLSGLMDYSNRQEQSGNVEGAAAAAEIALSKGIDVSVERKLAVLKNRIKNSNLIKVWQDQIEKTPNSVESHIGLAMALKNVGDIEAARKEFERVVVLDPGNSIAKEFLKTNAPSFVPAGETGF